MKKNYFNYKQVNDKYLLTNDIGRYVFLTKDQFYRFLMDKLESEEEIKKIIFFMIPVTMILWKKREVHSGIIAGICSRERHCIFLS